MNNTLYEKLEQLSESKQMVSLYLDGDTERFYAGYILGINEDNILFQHITPYGKYDGYILQRTSNVCRVGYDELYLKKIEKLHGFEPKKHKPITIQESNLVVSLLTAAAENDWIVSLELDKSDLDDVQGYVIKADSDNTIVKQITDEGQYDGETYFDTYDITSMECDTQKMQSIKILADVRGDSRKKGQEI